MNLLPRDMARRVALACAAGFVVSGVTVALVMGLLADRESKQQEDRNLRGAAQTFAQELAERRDDPLLITRDEQHELAHTGMSVALFEGHRSLTGSPSIAEVASGTCEDQGPRRACGVAAGQRIAVVAREQSAREAQREVTASSALIAVLVTSVLSTLLASSLARALVRPLVQLAAAVRKVTDPGSADLGAETQVREVETLRVSLSQAFARLSVALTESRRFASNAAHQLRTPLTAVLGELELAQEQLGSACPDELMRAHRVASRLHLMVDRLLILAQPSDRLELPLTVDLLEVLEESLDTLPTQLRGRVRHSGSSLCVPADQALLVAALVSALENALKFSDREVRAGIERRGAYGVLFVEDEGPGISASERERVFAPFYRARDAHTVPGHGLGLALIAHVLSKHGGDARFVDRTSGARIELSVPLLAAG